MYRQPPKILPSAPRLLHALVRRISFFIFFLIPYTLSLIPFTVSATEYTSSSYKVLDPVIEDGAGRRTSTSFINLESIGQNAIGISNSLNFTLKSGFLYFAEAAAGGGGESGGDGGGGLGNVPMHLLPFFAKPYFVIPPEEIEEIIEELPCPAGYIRQDLNCDGKVDLVDFSIFLFLNDPRQVRADNPADFNNDGSITVIDLSILFSAWTEKLTQLDSQVQAGPIVSKNRRDSTSQIIAQSDSDGKTVGEYLASFADKTRSLLLFGSSRVGTEDAIEQQPAVVGDAGIFGITWKNVLALGAALVALRLVFVAFAL